MITTYKFFFTNDVPTYSAEYDTGWNEGLQVGGNGGYEGRMSTEHNMARVRMSKVGSMSDSMYVYWFRGKVSVYIALENSTFKIVEQTPSMLVVETDSHISFVDEVGKTLVDAR